MVFFLRNIEIDKENNRSIIKVNEKIYPNKILELAEKDLSELIDIKIEKKENNTFITIKSDDIEETTLDFLNYLIIKTKENM
jgi:hypothetical protein